MANEEQLTFEFEERKTIKGYPELHWTGKRQFKSTVYYPAQLKENYGEGTPYTDKDGKTTTWLNKIFWGDNLQVMSHLLRDFRGKVDLIYIDPPFDSKADYKKKIKLKGQTIENDQSTFEEMQYGDIWCNDEYLQFIYERLILLRELLKTNGSIFVHCDYRVTSQMRIILDEVLGQFNFKNELIWQGAIGDTSAKNRRFIKSHDTIWFYTKNNDNTWNDVFQNFSETSEKIYRNQDENGFYRLAPIDNPGGGGYQYELGFGEKMPANGYRMPKSTALEWLAQGILDVREGKVPSKKIYRNENGVRCRDVWTDLASIQGNEHQGYPTQKPEALLERIIKASSNPGDLVFDCFMGSGTTQAVAMKLGRRFIGADINLGAVQTTTRRLLKIAKESQDTLLDEKPKYTGFEVYNVNNYEIFRNPLEARSILLQALEVEPFESSSVYDGEKDGRMVKILPDDVNRIATKADINHFIANLPYKVFERRKEENPHEPVLKLTVVCMGHEPDLGAAIKQELSDYKVDVEVVDILTDRRDLQFKRDAEGTIVVKDGKLVIQNFYPLNLMQKLSMQRENVENWRQLVESVMIDFNYDGAVLSPTVIDTPDKNELVKGVYDIPDGAGKIKVKITDLLSESLELQTEVK